jgi:hypothetical protein
MNWGKKYYKYKNKYFKLKNFLNINNQIGGSIPINTFIKNINLFESDINSHTDIEKYNFWRFF